MNKFKLALFYIFSFTALNSQSINLNESHLNNYLRNFQVLGELDTNYSFTIRPLNLESGLKEIDNFIFNYEDYSPIIFKTRNNKVLIRALPVDYNIEFSSHHPYNRNNGSMIPNRGYQQMVSAGLFIKAGPLSIQLKPEHVFAENKKFDGFWEGHYPVIWQRRYNLWNHSDIPERFGNKSHSLSLIGQSNIKLNFKGLSIGISNENIWWGPSIRNSIMMSNNSRGFKHVTFNTNKPLITKIGNFEWQVVSGRLESSGFTPPNIDYEYAGRKLYVPKINQLGLYEDWRYFQGLVLTYSPKFIDGLTIGFIRWAQMYSDAVEGKYFWMEGGGDYFPVFSNLFRKNDKLQDFEEQIDQAAGVFFRWLWKDSQAEIYGEFHYNDAKQNLRDLLLDSDHARAATFGLKKFFNNNNFLFSWEWTQLEQTGSRYLRQANSWYMHNYVYQGYTNHGEVMGASIGPGSNSHYFSFSKIKNKNEIGISFEIIDQDNDFYYYAFEDARDYRRYWKDYNLHLNYKNKFKNLWLSANLVFIKSLNYQWELKEDAALPYYRPGRDVNNFHINLKLTYELNFKN